MDDGQLTYHCSGYGNKEIGGVRAPGPLLTLAYSIFGAHNSFMEMCITELNDRNSTGRTEQINGLYCTKPPLSSPLPHPGMIGDDSRVNESLYTTQSIARHFANETSLIYQDWSNLTEWLASMASPQSEKSRSDIEEAFGAGLVAVNIASMGTVVDGYSYVECLRDMGADTQIPAISLPSTVVISVMLIVYLGILLIVACFTAFSPRWTDSMDGFAMMRVGASIADKVPLLVTYKRDEVNVLDELPGWIGGTDVAKIDEANSGRGEKGDTSSSEPIAKLELGSSCRLRGGQRYTCYDPDEQG